MKSSKEIEAMTNDELHDYYDQRCADYETDKAAGKYIGYHRTAELSELAQELRERGILWSRITDEILLKRYAIGLVVEPLDYIMDEWQAEIERRGLAFPEPYPDVNYAYEYWHDPDVKD